MKCKAEFFGLRELPVIDLSKETLEKLAERSTSIGLTVPGVQKKLSLHLSDEDSSRLTIMGHPSGYILKPQTEDYEQLPESEDLVMDIAEMMGVRVVPHGLIEVEGKWAYIAKRIDRMNGDLYAMEDFCQLSGRLTRDKYKSSYERCAGIIKSYSAMPGFDLSEFYLRLLVCFITGNSDMHLKNFSLIERVPGSREFVLSSAYDLLPVNVIMPEDTEETALTLIGKKSNIKRKDFLSFAETAGLNNKAAVHIIDSVVNKADEAIRMCVESYLDDEFRDQMITLIKTRTDRLI